MKTLDQRILIHASPDRVWAQISKIATNSQWQVDCTQVSFLTSLRKGPGVRWRCTHANGRESILETTTWYDRVGYEYKFIEGGPFKDCGGIVRIQDTPDGTVIQWILNYDPGGMFGNLRNSLSTQRRLEEMMAESLRNLWTLIKEFVDGEEEVDIDDITYQSRALMQEAPDVEQRSSYKPRHASAKEERTTTRELPIVTIPEPPLTEDDTRPRPAIANVEALPQADSPDIDEPDFLPDLYAKPQSTSDAPDPVASDADDALIVDELQTTTELDRTTKAIEAESHTQPTQRPERFDTLEISVFDVFGIAKPSESQQMRAVKESEADATPSTSITAPPTEPRGLILTQAIRTGLRLRLRQHLIKLRRPGN